MKSILFSFIVIISSINLSIAQWTHVDSLVSVYSFANKNGYLFASDYSNGVFRSANNGDDWAPVNSGLERSGGGIPGLEGYGIYKLTFIDTILYATASRSGAYYSTNYGESWNSISGLQNINVVTFASKGFNVYAALFSGVSLSTDHGSSWINISSGVSMLSIKDIAILGNHLYVCTTNWGMNQGQGIYHTINDGISWNAVNSGLTNLGVYCLAVSGTNLFTGTLDGVFLSTNYGQNWVACGLNYPVSSLAITNSTIFAGTSYNGVFLSNNNGNSWSPVNMGLPAFLRSIQALFISGEYVFLANEDGVWRRSLSELISGVVDQTFYSPTKFDLEQNYPNPFNPSTTISFRIPSKAYVSLKVFDLLGKEVITLISEMLLAGQHSYEWNAVNMPSGVYFYRLQVGTFTKTKKLILLR